jgi:hypothetical protein
MTFELWLLRNPSLSRRRLVVELLGRAEEALERLGPPL